jgi:multidrug efflux system membrane fusion protein
VQAFDRTGGAAIANGSLATIDNVVDTTTGTVKGKARFANPTGALFPNQFVNITVLVDTLKNQVIVPTTAIRHGPSSDFVWLLQSDNTVTQRTVKTGPGTGETTSVTSGLNAGETVITDGGDRLREGAPVTLPHSHAGTGAGSGGGKGSGHHKGGGANTNSTNTNSTNSTGGGAGGMGMFGGAG